MSLKQVKSILVIFLIALVILFITDQYDFATSLMSSLGIGYENTVSVKVIIALGLVIVVRLIYYRKRVTSLLELKKKAASNGEDSEGMQFAKKELEISRQQGVLGLILFTLIFIEIISKLFSTLDVRLIVPAVVALAFLGIVYIQKQASKDIHSFSSERIKLLRTIVIVTCAVLLGISAVIKIVSDGLDRSESIFLIVELGVFIAMILLTPKEYIKNFFKFPNLSK